VAELSRRTFLALGATIVVGACSSDDSSSEPTEGATNPSTTSPPTTSPPTTSPPTTRPAASSSSTTAAPTTTNVSLAENPFTLGVTSGDPDETSAVLWTRLTGADLPDTVDVTWELADDPSFATTSADGTATAESGDGHSVHAVVELDAPAWYRFTVGDWTSPVGRVAPAPAGAVDELRLATASCQHWESGFYAAHRDIAEWAPDLVVFLGDFIYEGAGQPIAEGRVREHEGAEPTDLDGYRARYAQYLSDPELQAARGAAPWLVIWDDHEVENNYASLIPQDAADAPTFPDRRAAAYRAWWEHMPVRLPRPDGGDYPIYRALRWGDLANLVLLDGRQYRSDQACGSPSLSLDPACPEAFDPARTMLGAAQEEWLGAQFAEGTGTWTVVAQQTVLTDLRYGEAILNYDQWDGYTPARDRLLAQAATADRVVVLTGDIHLAGVGVLPGVGVEFVTSSISSTGLIDPALQPILDTFDAVVASELAHRGYTRHTVTPSTWTAEYRIVNDVIDPASAVSTWSSFGVDAAARDTVVPA